MSTYTLTQVGSRQGSDGGERSDAHCRSRQANNEGYSVIEIYGRSRGILAGL